MWCTVHNIAINMLAMCGWWQCLQFVAGLWWYWPQPPLLPTSPCSPRAPQQKQPLSCSCRAQLNTLAYPLFQLSMLCYIELHWLLYIILTYNVTVFHGVSGSLLAPCRLYITIAFLDDLLSCCVVALNLRINYGYKRDIFYGFICKILHVCNYLYVFIIVFMTIIHNIRQWFTYLWYMKQCTIFIIHTTDNIGVVSIAGISHLSCPIITWSQRFLLFHLLFWGGDCYCILIRRPTTAYRLW